LFIISVLKLESYYGLPGCVALDVLEAIGGKY